MTGPLGRPEQLQKLRELIDKPHTPGPIALGAKDRKGLVVFYSVDWHRHTGLPEPYGTGALEPPDEPAPKGKLCDGCSPIVEREK